MRMQIVQALLLTLTRRLTKASKCEISTTSGTGLFPEETRCSSFDSCYYSFSSHILLFLPLRHISFGQIKLMVLPPAYLFIQHLPISHPLQKRAMSSVGPTTAPSKVVKEGRKARVPALPKAEEEMQSQESMFYVHQGAASANSPPER